MGQESMAKGLIAFQRTCCPGQSARMYNASFKPQPMLERRRSMLGACMGLNHTAGCLLGSWRSLIESSCERRSPGLLPAPINAPMALGMVHLTVHSVVRLATNTMVRVSTVEVLSMAVRSLAVAMEDSVATVPPVVTSFVLVVALVVLARLWVVVREWAVAKAWVVAKA